MSRFLSLRRSIRLALVFAFVCVLSATSPAQNPAQIYQQIKNLEGNFPLPTPKESVSVGAFNAQAGIFTGKCSGNCGLPPEGRADVPPREKVTPVAHVNAVNVELIFNVTHRTGDFRVTANGISALAGAGQSSVTVNVGPAQRVNWKVQSGLKSYSDTLVIQRPRIIGAGAFTIPILPLAIIYEPPPDSRNMNKATYSVTKAIGSKVTASFSYESTTTADAAPSQFADVKALGSKMSSLASVVKNAPGVPYAQQIGGALNSIADGLGSASASETNGTVNASDHSLELTNIIATTISTGENDGGPGVGDVVYYLKNPKLVWLAENGRLTLALLDHGVVATAAVSNLRANLNSGWQGLDRESIKNLLALDPFTSPKRLGLLGWQLSEPRFSYLDTYEMNAAEFAEGYTSSATRTDTHTTTNYTTKLEDYRKGWLSFIGLGVSEDTTVKTTITHSSMTGVTVTEAQQVTAEFYAQAQEVYDVEVYFDNLFGTFAFRKVPTLPTPVVAGRALDHVGHPAAKQLVTLAIGNKKFSTRTDAQGRYAFRASTIKQGNAVLTLGGLRKNFQLMGTPMSNVELRLFR